MISCVCIDPHEYDGPDFEHVKMIRARKQHKCCECRGPILPGSTYENARSVYDGRWAEHKTCSVCAAIRSDFFPCGFIYGDLWDELREMHDDEDLSWLD